MRLTNVHRTCINVLMAYFICDVHMCFSLFRENQKNINHVDIYFDASCSHPGKKKSQHCKIKVTCE